jgi:flagellar hook assembly protein FlgD
MNKSAVAGALIALTGSALVAPSSAVGDPLVLPAPQVTIAGGDLLVSEVQGFTVSADSAAVSVSFTYGGQQLPPVEVIEEPTGTFTAAGDFETWGLSGDHDLVVAQCEMPDGSVCGETTTITTTVANPSPTYDLSRPSPFSHPFDLTVRLAHSSGFPTIKLTTDAVTTTFVNPEAVTEVDTDALDEGAHTIDIEVCAADHAPCTPGPTVPFDVVHSVPGTFSVSPLVFSPNGDGQFDSVRFDYTQQDEWESADLEIRNAVDVLVLQTPVDLPVAPSNDGSFTYNGKGTGGAYLADGSYTATLRVSRTVDGQPVESAYNEVFTVDRTALAPPKLTPSPSTFYPYRDGYRDSTRVIYGNGEPYSRVDLKVRNSAGKLVRSKQIFSSADATWSGRRNDGSRVPEGKYSLRLRVVDKLGNVGLSPVATVTVDDAKLVKVIRSVTVTPKASRVSATVGDCSTMRTPSVHGWAGSTSYLSNTKCRKTVADSIVWTHNKVQLQRAAKYFKVRLGWYGGPTRAATHDRAVARLYGPDFSDQGTYSSVDYMASQYVPWVTASLVLNDGYFHWSFQTDRGNRYDVKSFTITYQVGVLR